MKPLKKYMRLALGIAERGVRRGNSPFGSCIVKGDRVIALSHNTVLTEKDATNHAEMNAVRLACRKLRSHQLDGCVIYSTTEPCPMCFSAIHWARIGTIVYGTGIADAKRLGFSELTVSDRRLKKEGRSRVRISSGFMRQECLELLREWKEMGGRTY